MKDIALIRHGRTIVDGLLPVGIVEVELAVSRWKRACDLAGVYAWHAPAKRAVESARIFTRSTGIPSEVSDLLAIATAHDVTKQQLFADMVLQVNAKHVVLIGHDENRAHLEAIIRRKWGMLLASPECPIGGVLHYAPGRAYRIL